VPRFISRALFFALRLVLLTFAAIFAISLLLASLVVLALGLLRALFTGQKAKPVDLGKFQRFSAQATWGKGKNPGAAPAQNGDVVDVEVREIREDPPRS
jgi:hypothetical protein